MHKGQRRTQPPGLRVCARGGGRYKLREMAKKFGDLVIVPSNPAPNQCRVNLGEARKWFPEALIPSVGGSPVNQNMPVNTHVWLTGD